MMKHYACVYVNIKCLALYMSLDVCFVFYNIYQGYIYQFIFACQISRVSRKSLPCPARTAGPHKTHRVIWLRPYVAWCVSVHFHIVRNSLYFRCYIVSIYFAIVILSGCPYWHTIGLGWPRSLECKLFIFGMLGGAFLSNFTLKSTTNNHQYLKEHTGLSCIRQMCHEIIACFVVNVKFASLLISVVFVLPGLPWNPWPKSVTCLWTDLPLGIA